jgi:hypothetical protein
VQNRRYAHEFVQTVRRQFIPSKFPTNTRQMNEDRTKLSRAIVRILVSLSSTDIELSASDPLRVAFDAVATLGLAHIERVGKIDVFAITDGGKQMLART